MVSAGSPSSRPPAVETQQRLSVAVWGGLSITLGAAELPLPNRKARAILGYLAINGRERRERLAGLFWPESSEKRARISLRQALFDVRRVFESSGSAVLAADANEVALSPDRVELDLERLFAVVAAGDVPQSLLETPRGAEALFAGYDDLSPMFGEWIATWRNSVLDRLLGLLTTLYEDGSRSPLARRRSAEGALQLDPLQEGACRALMRLAAENGETALALRTYDSLYTLLGEEHDMEPAAETQALVADIKQGRFDPMPAPREARGPEPAASVPPRIALSAAGAPVLAVFPLRPLGPDPVPTYFADGLLDDTVCRLAMLREPVVISGNSTRGISSGHVDLTEVGQRLGAQYIVSGTLRRSGEEMRVAVELADTTTRTVLWGGTYGCEAKDLFNMQSEIAMSIARTLVPQLRDAELRQSRRRGPEDMTAYHLMLQARELTFRLDRAAFERAGDFLRRAVELDPGYAPTHAAAADWYSLRIGQGWSPDPPGDTRKVEELARAAIGADSANGRGLAMLAHNRTILERDYDEALNLFERALDACPNDAETLMWSSPTNAFIGNAKEAVRRAERAIALSPEDPLIFRYEHFLSIAHYAAGDYEAAAHWALRSMHRNPQYTSNLRTAAAAIAALGRAEQARGIARKVIELQPGFRVEPMIERHAFRDLAQRELYAKHLIAAGLPP